METYLKSKKGIIYTIEDDKPSGEYYVCRPYIHGYKGNSFQPQVYINYCDVAIVDTNLSIVTNHIID